MDKVMCPGCGKEMAAKKYKSVSGGLPYCERWRVECECGWAAPFADDENAARAAALRRAEPENRVLTLEEVERWGNIEKLPIWLEFRYMGGQTQLVASLYGGVSDKGVHLYDSGWIPHPMGAYGKRFRFWLRRPTDEERAAAKWEVR